MRRASPDFLLSWLDYGDSLLVDYGDSLLEFSQQRQLPLGGPVHSGLWARFAGCQVPAELPLERRDPLRRAKRPSDRGGPARSEPSSRDRRVR
jgi:hypothetical protein